MNRSPLADVVRTQKALAHPARLRLLAMLDAGELCVCQMAAVLGLAASTVSSHLAELRVAGLVAEAKHGRFVHYGWAPEAEADEVRRALRRRLAADPRIESDARILVRLRAVPLADLCRVDLDLARLGIERSPEAEGSRTAGS